MAIEPLVYVVHDLLPQGVTILSSAPKLGKSFMCLQLSLAVAEGASFLGRQTTQMGVLYMALEDGNRRLKDRMSAILKGRQAPPHLYFITETGQTDNYLYQAMDYYLAQDRSIGLVIIDTFQKVRGADAIHGKYLYDSREVSALKQYADNRGISILLVHHTRKASGEGDAHAKISGTQGLFGSCDTSMVLDKKARNDSQATLHITGRDVQQQDLIIQFDTGASCWEASGVAPDVDRQNYENNAVVQTIRELLTASPDGRWQGKVSELMDVGRNKGRILANSPQGLGKELARLKADLYDYDGIQHNTTCANGNGNRIHHFYALTLESPVGQEQVSVYPTEAPVYPSDGWDGTGDDIDDDLDNDIDDDIDDDEPDCLL